MKGLQAIEVCLLSYFIFQGGWIWMHNFKHQSILLLLITVIWCKPQERSDSRLMQWAGFSCEIKRVQSIAGRSPNNALAANSFHATAIIMAIIVQSSQLFLWYGTKRWYYVLQGPPSVLKLQVLQPLQYRFELRFDLDIFSRWCNLAWAIFAYSHVCTHVFPFRVLLLKAKGILATPSKLPPEQGVNEALLKTSCGWWPLIKPLLLVEVVLGGVARIPIKRPFKAVNSIHFKTDFAWSNTARSIPCSS